MDAVQGLFDFIKNSPTAFHAVNNICQMLDEAGYMRLEEGQSWHTRPGGRYYVTRNLSSVIAFRLPEIAPDHFQVVASHSDSPCFKLKPAFDRKARGYALLNAEKYGGAILSTWFDRPLSVAGRVIVRTDEGFEAHLVSIDRDLALIPNLPIHFNREVNDGMKLNPQVDLVPICGAEGTDLLGLIAGSIEVEKTQIVGSDLFLINRDAPRRWGADGEYITAPRLDDLECAWTSTRAFIEAAQSRHVDVLCVFDNEEVGSGTRQGADSTFLADTLRRLSPAPETALARSFLLSADNAHAIHPNHPEKYDDENQVRMNGGVVVKFNASQKYTSDGVSQAVFEAVCRDANVPVQRFANRSDIPGGSTLGNISNTHASMISVDIGLAQLSMHSANESAGARDVLHMIDALRTFHESEIDVVRDGLIRVN